METAFLHLYRVICTYLYRDDGRQDGNHSLGFRVSMLQKTMAC